METMQVPALAGLTSVAPLTNPILISDLHLTLTKPKTLLAFTKFLDGIAKRYPELVILGDFFDFWIGDDAMSGAEPIAALLKSYTASGHRLLIMQGNRDVMLGEGFAAACGAELIADPIAVEIRGRRVLLSHGDQWCLRDETYQAFRQMVRNPQWQAAVLAKPVPERIALAQEARMKSEGDKSAKSDAEMDVVESAVAEAARAAGVDLVIHGHTHKPAAHVGAKIERWVLPDWEYDDPEGTGRSGYIVFHEDGRPQIRMI